MGLRRNTVGVRARDDIRATQHQPEFYRQMRERCHEALVAAGTRGLDSHEVRAMFQLSQNSTTNQLRTLAREGRVESRSRGARYPLQWYAMGFAPAQPAMPSTANSNGMTVSVRGSKPPPKWRAEWPADAPGKLTPNTRYTEGPAHIDRRYMADPSIAGRGVISEDWMARRQGAA